MWACISIKLGHCRVSSFLSVRCSLRRKSRDSYAKPMCSAIPTFKILVDRGVFGLMLTSNPNFLGVARCWWVRGEVLRSWVRSSKVRVRDSIRLGEPCCAGGSIVVRENFLTEHLRGEHFGQGFFQVSGIPWRWGVLWLQGGVRGVGTSGGCWGVW
ncbi:hypothetical protein CRG98_020368 [Punica granatum]|uniref:Uncharacterized protein n=1 Tax=Punica granatum TaxID=22663 RepID=A0A2I0JSE1_PUNGR|nr:hypothetical protein CRG98_020368 [Punica granatum]